LLLLLTFIIDIQYAGRGFEGITALQGLWRKSEKTYFKNGRL